MNLTAACTPYTTAQRRRSPSGRLCRGNQLHARTTGAQRTACEGLSRLSACFRVCCRVLELQKDDFITVVHLHVFAFLTMSITPTDRNINYKPGIILQRDEADRLRSYNQMMESHEQRMAGLTL